MSSPTASPTAVPNWHPADTPLDHRSLLNVVCWCLAIVTSLVVGARLWTKLAITRALELDDMLITGSWALAIGQTVVLSIAVANGFGLVSTDVPEHADMQQKAIYIFMLLFFVGQYCTKLSLLSFLRNLTPRRSHRILIYASGAAATAWVLAAIFSLIFQCQLPNIWQILNNRCLDRVVLFTALEGVNIVLDMVLIAVPIAITWHINLRFSKRMILFITMLTRTFVIIAIGAQIIVLWHGPLSVDPFLCWAFALTTQLAEYLSIATACGPCLRPLFDNLSSGMIFNDDIRRANNASQRSSRRNRWGSSKGSRGSKGKSDSNDLGSVMSGSGLGSGMGMYGYQDVLPDVLPQPDVGGFSVDIMRNTSVSRAMSPADLRAMSPDRELGKNWRQERERGWDRSGSSMEEARVSEEKERERETEKQNLDAIINNEGPHDNYLSSPSAGIALPRSFALVGERNVDTERDPEKEQKPEREAVATTGGGDRPQHKRTSSLSPGITQTRSYTVEHAEV